MDKITRIDHADGGYFEWNQTTGETGLYHPDGTYFRDMNDYDHGSSWRVPGMNYAQLRRGRFSSHGHRFVEILMLFFFSAAIPFIFGSLAWDAGPAWGIPVTVAALALGIFCAYSYTQTKLFQFSWNGRLYFTDAEFQKDRQKKKVDKKTKK